MALSKRGVAVVSYCPEYSETEETVEHILLECPIYTTIKTFPTGRLETTSLLYTAWGTTRWLMDSALFGIMTMKLKCFRYANLRINFLTDLRRLAGLNKLTRSDIAIYLTLPSTSDWVWYKGLNPPPHFGRFVFEFLVFS